MVLIRSDGGIDVKDLICGLRWFINVHGFLVSQLVAPVSATKIKIPGFLKIDDTVEFRKTETQRR